MTKQSMEGDTPAAAGPRPILLTAWFAIVAALAELAVLAVEKFGWDAWIHADIRIIWLAPASYLAWMLPLGIVLAVGLRFVPTRWRSRAAVFLPSVVAAFSVLWMFYPRLHRFAILVLALGIGVQSARMLAPRLATFQARAVRHTAGALAVLVLVAIATTVGPWVRERRALAALPASAAGAPNIILVVLDTVRALSMGMYGHERPTSPALDALARRGVVFESAHATTSWTLPSHATLFTGMYPHELSAGWVTPLDASAPTLAEVLSQAGYRTAGFVANLLYCSRETGLARGFHRYEDAVVDAAEIAMSSALGRFVVQNPALRRLLDYQDVLGRRTATHIADAFLRWHEGLDGGPYFAFLNLYDAHAPYLPPEPFATQFATAVERQNHLIRHTSKRAGARTAKIGMSPPEIEAELRAYEAGIAYMDAELARLFAELDRRGSLDNTIIIVTSDHGELFGEHGQFAHGQHLYRPLIEVPLLFAGAVGIDAGRVVKTPVSLRDVPATILDLAGLEPLLPGMTLAPLWSGTGADASPVLAQLEPAPNQTDRQFTASSPMRSLVNGEYHYIGWTEGREQLFHRQNDPEQLHDLAGDPAYSHVLSRLRAEAEAAGGWRRHAAGESEPVDAGAEIATPDEVANTDGGLIP